MAEHTLRIVSETTNNPSPHQKPDMLWTTKALLALAIAITNPPINGP